jgi:FkbM family methyltransferase
MSVRDKTLHALTRSGFVRSAYGVLRKIPGAGGGIEKLVHAALPPGKRLWIRIPEGIGKGLWMDVDPRFDMGYVNGNYEPWIQELLKSELRPGDCYYDAGAHIGFFAMIASRLVERSGKVVAIEPDPDNAATLRANLTRNDIEQVSVVEAAVWSSSGQVTFERALGGSNRTQGHIGQAAARRHADITVPAVQLDEMVFEKGYPAPDLMKMDIEGAEWGALQGARLLLSEKKPKLLCEVHDAREVGKIRDYLTQLGYATEERKPFGELYAGCRELYLWAVPALQQAAVETGSRTNFR